MFYRAREGESVTQTMRTKTKVKFCGLSRAEDVAVANELCPEYVGFVLWPKSSRYVSPERAQTLKAKLAFGIRAVGVFVDEDVNVVAGLLNAGVIDIAQLHGSENNDYIGELRLKTPHPIYQAVKIRSEDDIFCANASAADLVLLDAGMGQGHVFDWTLVSAVRRPYLLAGGLNLENVDEALCRLHPFGVDVSSGIETCGAKDPAKMRAFMACVREVERAF